MNVVNDYVMIMLIIVRLSKEYYDLDYHILRDFEFYVPFRKTLNSIIMYTLYRVDP